MNPAVHPGEWTRAVHLLPYFLEVLWSGTIMTVIVTAGGFVASILLGVFVAALRTGSSRLLAGFAHAYVEVFRAVPVLTQLFIIYFGLAAIGIRLSPIPAAIVGFGLNGGAYLSEVFRGGIQAVHRGQTEAALAIGMTPRMAFRWIVLPQATRIVLPSIANFAIGLLKDTSLASAVAAPELSFRAHMLVDETYLSTQIYLLVAAFYMAMSLPLSLLVRWLERRGRPARAA
ncbi:MAG: amino acid ABC transporter permease [Proteobacteria bacterium]|nr:amino acid ABC transporter permease [Pseudomonadota bacterium]